MSSSSRGHRSPVRSEGPPNRSENRRPASAARRGDQPGPWRRELTEFIRAVSGAFLFGMPLLFTMEMWWRGIYAEPWQLLLMLLVAFIASLGLTYFAGCRRGPGLGDHLQQAVNTVAVGVLSGIAVLLALNRISLDDPAITILGKIIVQAVPLSIGAAAANAVFAPGETRTGDESGQEDVLHATLNDLGATAVGGVFVGFSIAPTEEIPMLAAEVTYWHLIGVVLLTVVLTYAIVFESGFDPQQGHPAARDLFQTPLSETAATYLVSLAVALVALYLFNDVSAATPLPNLLAQTLVLGLPTAVGGAAGRLVI